MDLDINGMLLGARLSGGVLCRPYNYRKFTSVYRVTKSIDQRYYEDAIGWLYDQTGKPYDIKSILSFAADRNWRDDNAWFCSELMAAFCENAHICKPIQRVSKITPNDLMLILSVA